jgi:Ca2+-binding EF-hand superfamily protein
MLTKAITPALVEKVIDLVWRDFDTDGNGVLDIKEAKKFVDLILRQIYGEGKYNLGKFSSWFAQFDKDHSGSIEKPELVGFITKLAKSKNFGIKDLSVY